MKRYQLGLALGMILAGLCLTTGCPAASTTTPAAPANPPQVTVLNYVQLAATMNNTAAHTLLTLCTVAPGATAPTLDQGTCDQVKQYLTVAANTFTQIGTEAASSDPWATMRIKIAAIGATAATTTAVSNPVLQQQIASLQSLIAQILGVQ